MRKESDSKYSYCIAQAENPTEELLADGNGNSNLEMTVINLDRNNIMTKAIKRSFHHQAIECLGFKGVCTSYDFRTTYATELCEAGLTSKQVADKMGHKDTRMVDRIYARTRHESVMVNAAVLDKLNESMIL